MALRYLFGPVSQAFPAPGLDKARAAGHCLTFAGDGSADLSVAPTDTWEMVASRLPPDWLPDFLALQLPTAAILPAMRTAPLPTIGLAGTWNLHWHYYRRLPALGCDLLITDLPGVRHFAAEGIAARAAVLDGVEHGYLDQPGADGPRDIDVLYVGNLHPAAERLRLIWVGRLARLSSRWHVAIRSGKDGDDCRRLLARARIVVNFSGGANRRVVETLAAGALLFQEAGNEEEATLLVDRQEFVAFGPDDFEELLHHYLENEHERRRLAAAGQAKAARFNWEQLWQDAVTGLERNWESVLERYRQRPPPNAAARRAGLLWQGCDGSSTDPALARDFAAALAERPTDAVAHHALGVLTAVGLDGTGVEAALAYFRRALTHDPDHVVAALNAAECLAALGQRQAAVEQASQALRVLERQPALAAGAVLDSPHVPVAFDLFRVEWERTAWENAGRPAAEGPAKRLLLRWRLHLLLAELTGELLHYHEAALARPDLSLTRAMLGCALGRAGRVATAIPHLRQAVAENPFDVEAARALHQAMADDGDATGARRLAYERRLLTAATATVPAEPWFASAAPPPDALTSILILCCNEVAYTRQCLASVLRHTLAPYELVLIDNGSTDDTPAYLAEVSSQSGPARIRVIRNETNLGFPAGCNQALAQARGDYVVFLNNDTVVTAGWLDGLVGKALLDGPPVGLVGATTNYSRPPQQIPVEYDIHTLDGLDAFAGKLRRTHGEQFLPVQRLTGFCLLARRDALRQVGGFDEQYGLGFFDDDDLCVRVLEAGYRLLMAPGVYIHHYGSRTFRSLNVDCPAQLTANFERFRQKWGDEHSRGYRMAEAGAPFAAGGPPETAPVDRPQVVPSASCPKVSLCMIVKNEEHNLPACLDSVATLVDEIIVADTGSSDDTRAVARRYGARVVEFPWVDSFAAARNASLAAATGRWIFWMDADDRLDAANGVKLRQLFASLPETPEMAGYVLKCSCLPDPKSGSTTVVDHVRLFPNSLQLRWEYRVHEQILPSLRRLGGRVQFTDVVVQHVGYQDLALRGRKLERDLRLLGLEDAERPDDPFTLFNLGSVYQELGRLNEAVPLLRRSLERSQPADSIVRKLYALIAGCHRQLRQPAEALAACQAGRQHYPDDVELLFQEALAQRELGRLDAAEACLLTLLATQPGQHFASVDAGLRGYKARNNLAAVYQAQGRRAEAAAQWEAVLAEQPAFAPALLGLTELAAESGNDRELEQRCACLHEAGLTLEAGVLRARGRLAGRDFAGARALLEPLIAAHPEQLWPRRIFSHALLQEGVDYPAAERALLEVLRLAPADAEAANNLAVLHRLQATPTTFPTLEQRYERACRTPSDINEHLPTLRALACECRHITEMGTRTGVSTLAWLAAQPERLVCYDRVRFPEVDELERLAGRTQLTFHQADVLAVDIEPTDLLFIDTWHVEEQLRAELHRHADKVRRYIVLHDTTTFGERGETEGHRGLWPAAEEFLAQGAFGLRERHVNNHGLTVLERLARN